MTTVPSASTVSASNQRLCLWLGMAMMPLFFLGFGVLAGFIPPPSPAADPVAIARTYEEDRTAFRIGMLIATAAAALLTFFFAVIAAQMGRIEGPVRALTYVQVIAGACTVLEFILPPLIWQTAAFRAERDPATVQMLNDLAWLPFLGITGTLIAQQLAIAVAALRDPRPDPVFPRWSAYVNLLTALGIVPASFIMFFKTGPLAWDGALAWWLVLVDYFAWMVTMGFVLHRAIAQQEREGS